MLRQVHPLEPANLVDQREDLLAVGCRLDREHSGEDLEDLRQVRAHLLRLEESHLALDPPELGDLLARERLVLVELQLQPLELDGLVDVQVDERDEDPSDGYGLWPWRQALLKTVESGVRHRS